ncbi:MAG: HAMP domain-containing histidine kinase [Lachnospiraceae bacterium]|nr:HAMP domain-containing histidine kinase [Muribaculum sp.]MCM1409901.1 HAMP domain-containing histidine kinase [Lachnospiraceae bacterium]
MSGKEKAGKNRVRISRFPVSLVAIYLVMFLVMSGMHMGIIVLMGELRLNPVLQSIIPILYWLLVSVGMTIFTRYKMRQVYEIPMQKLAEAASQVAHGDFSVFVPALHTADKYDYLDVMIQDFNRMVEDLGSIETLKTDFFSNVSHEIKTPLAVIQNTATLLRNETISEKQRQEYVNTIIGASKRLSSLITNILKLNKLEKQTISPDIAEYDLPAQLAECALQFERVWEDKNIEFDAELEEEACITADPSLMELVWNNLLSNALKFTEPGGKVSLTQTTEDGMIIVQVEDTGCGMDEDTMRHSFDKFYQGDSSHSTEGNGLGLALVRRIVQMMDAEIHVQSALGKGTVFTVRMARSDRKNKN